MLAVELPKAPKGDGAGADPEDVPKAEKAGLGANSVFLDAESSFEEDALPNRGLVGISAVVLAAGLWNALNWLLAKIPLAEGDEARAPNPEAEEELVVEPKVALPKDGPVLEGVSLGVLGAPPSVEGVPKPDEPKANELPVPFPKERPVPLPAPKVDPEDPKAEEVVSGAGAGTPNGVAWACAACPNESAPPVLDAEDPNVKAEELLWAFSAGASGSAVSAGGEESVSSTSTGESESTGLGFVVAVAKHAGSFSFSNEKCEVEPSVAESRRRNAPDANWTTSMPVGKTNSSSSSVGVVAAKPSWKSSTCQSEPSCVRAPTSDPTFVQMMMRLFADRSMDEKKTCRPFFGTEKKGTTSPCSDQSEPLNDERSIVET